MGEWVSSCLFTNSLQIIPTGHHGIAGFEELQNFGIYVRCRDPFTCFHVGGARETLGRLPDCHHRPIPVPADDVLQFHNFVVCD